MIRLNSYWINFFAHFTILTIGMSIATSINHDIHGFVPVRIVLALIDAYIFPFFRTK